MKEYLPAACFTAGALYFLMQWCEKKGKVFRVLVTGFTDWHEVEGDIFKCEKNPSGRVVIGGKLDEMLREKGKGVEWHFLRLPVVWGTAKVIDYAAYDVVINIGLNSGAADDIITLEDGAFNGRRGADAVGHAISEPLDHHGCASLSIPALSSIVRSLHNTKVAPFSIATTAHRPSNSYICNETHWNTLSAVQQGHIAAGYFVHIPDVKVSDLSSALCTLILTLVAKSKPLQ
eukprot:TRINITY_DN1890_c1_g1_i1.p1 TRINITY_DN1890_c1_g1~~TRINITY_DN1890_c1_g1_i1.p1  ORF type:complete len:232 (+),score=54.13 TRINITY_DN1890_c1_g1_i1:30-725(+)